jgi:tetratricopeptide (TPR) repeat protein/spermidine synthase
VFPAYLLISFLLPYVCNRLQSDRRHLGIAYGLNTLAFCFGMIAFTWLAPRVNTFYSMKLMMVTLAIGAALLLVIREHRRLAAWKPALAVAALGAACVVTPAGFDPSYVTPHQPAALYPVRAMKSNGAHTTYVVAAPDGDRLYFDNYSMSGTSHRAQVYMRLMAHFPLLAHPRPQRALLICFGVGNTAAAIASHDTVRHIDVVELNDKVIETAPEFARHNDEVYLDPRMRFIHDDGRNFLNSTESTYDLITSEPPPPMYAGVYRLYSKEYYQQAMAHLSQEGMMTQWLPVYQMPQEAVDLAVATFVGVFPHVLLFSGYETEFILVGSRSPIDVGQIEQRFYEQPSVVADLRKLEIQRPLQLIARVVKGERALSRQFGDRRMISDQRNDLTYLFPRPLAPGMITYNPPEVLADIGVERLQMHEALRAVVMHLGRLRYAADFPYESLQTVRPDEAPGVMLTDVDWAAIQSIRERCSQLERAGRGGDASTVRRAKEEMIALFRRALAMAGEQPELLLALASSYADAGRHDDAITVLRRFQQIEPDDPAGYYGDGVSLIALQRYGQAIPLIRRALDLAPDEAPVHFALASALESNGNLAEAEVHYRRAVTIDPDHVEARMNLGITLARSGRVDEALSEWRQALKIDPEHPVLHHNLATGLKSQGRLEEAISHYRRALQLKPDYAAVHRILGVALMETGQLEEAIGHLREALRLNPRDGEARRNLDRARAMLEAAGR